MKSVIGYTSEVKNNKVLITDSFGQKIHSNNIEELLCFLLESLDEKDNRTHLKAAWNLDQFVAPLLKLIGQNNCKKLASNNHKVKLGDFTLFYIPKKLFSIKLFDRGNYYEALLYDISQYYPKYDDQDAISTAAAGGVVISALEKIGIFNPIKLTSPIAIYQNALLKYMDIPTLADMPNKALEAASYAYRCAGKAWTTAYKIGHFDKVFDYDLTCYSEDTECLTINGWKYIKNLEIGENILGFNTKTNKCRFQPVIKITSSEYSGDMIALTSRKVDLLVTPNHRVLLKNHIRCENAKAYRENGKHSFTDWLVYEAGNLPNGNYKMPISYPIEDKPDYSVSDNLIQLIAWINTEGHIIYVKCKNKREYNGVGITQSECNPENKIHCITIENILKELPFKYYHYTRQRLYSHLIKRGINRVSYKDQTDHQFNIITTINNLRLDNNDIHLIPLWILQNCSIRQLKIYFNTLISGDGTKSKSPIGHYYIKTAFYTKLKTNADRMMYLCHLLGYKISCKPPDKNHTTWRLYIIPEKEATTQKRDENNELINWQPQKNKAIQYNGMVYCPTVKDSFLVVRRNNKSCICGNSAYPSVASQLFSTKYCSYKKANHYIPCHVAFLKGTITINAPISPIIYRTKDGNLIPPIGTWDGYFTSEEITFIEKWKLGSFKLKDGWFLTFKAPVKPLELPLQRLYAIRRKSVYDELVNRITKGIGVGIIGKMAERFIDGTPGEYFNPIWHSLVTSRVRLKVAEFIFANDLTKDLVHTSVDGILTTKEVKLPKQNDMGSWRLSSSGSALVISSGQLFYGDKHPKGINYEALMTMIKANLDEGYYGTKKLRPQTLAEAIESNDIDNIGTIKEYWTSIDLAQSMHKHDRIFSKLPYTGRDLLKRVYNSKPLDITLIKEKEIN